MILHRGNSYGWVGMLVFFKVLLLLTFCGASTPIFTLAADNSSLCHFDQYFGVCNVVLHNRTHLQVITIINHCVYPVDVTFLMHSDDPSFDWSYTFLANNPPEHPVIPELQSEIPVSLHVELQLLNRSGKNELEILAEFHIENEKPNPFLNITVPISQHECLVKPKERKRAVYLVVGLISAVSLSFIIACLMLKRIRLRKPPPLTGDRSILVDNMESTISNPPDSTVSSPGSNKSEYKVEFRVPERSDCKEDGSINLTNSTIA